MAEIFSPSILSQQRGPQPIAPEFVPVDYNLLLNMNKAAQDAEEFKFRKTINGLKEFNTITDPLTKLQAHNPYHQNIIEAKKKQARLDQESLNKFIQDGGLDNPASFAELLARTATFWGGSEIGNIKRTIDSTNRTLDWVTKNPDRASKLMGQNYQSFVDQVNAYKADETGAVSAESLNPFNFLDTTQQDFENAYKQGQLDLQQQRIGLDRERLGFEEDRINLQSRGYDLQARGYDIREEELDLKRGTTKLDPFSTIYRNNLEAGMTEQEAATNAINEVNKAKQSAPGSFSFNDAMGDVYQGLRAQGVPHEEALNRAARAGLKGQQNISYQGAGTTSKNGEVTGINTNDGVTISGKELTALKKELKVSFVARQNPDGTNTIYLKSKPENEKARDFLVNNFSYQSEDGTLIFGPDNDLEDFVAENEDAYEKGGEYYIPLKQQSQAALTAPAGEGRAAEGLPEGTPALNNVSFSDGHDFSYMSNMAYNALASLPVNVHITGTTHHVNNFGHSGKNMFDVGLAASGEKNKAAKQFMQSKLGEDWAILNGYEVHFEYPEGVQGDPEMVGSNRLAQVTNSKRADALHMHFQPIKNQKLLLGGYEEVLVNYDSDSGLYTVVRGTDRKRWTPQMLREALNAQ